MHTAAELVNPMTAAEAGKLCTHEGCGKPAIYAYTWAWGETGKCCADHQFELQQKAEQLARTISFVPLDAGIAPAVERDERIGYNAKILTLEEELAASRARGLELYTVNTKLAEEGRLLMARNNDLGRRLDASQSHALELEQRNAELLSANGERQEEIDRLRAFLPSDEHG